MSGRIIALDKQPDVRTFGVGETWRRLFANILLKVMVTEATMACQDDQLCAGLKSGINGAIHGVKYLWDETIVYVVLGFFTRRRKERVQRD